MEKGHIFFISGVAWAGKGTVIKKILELNIKNVSLALSCKTRNFRGNEIDGIDYNRLSTAQFKREIESWAFLEYNFVHNQDYYGTRFIDVIDNGINQWKMIIKEIDILTLPGMLEAQKELRPYFTCIFLDLPLEMIKERMGDRGDDITGIDFENRMISAEKEKNLHHLCDHIIDATQSPEQVLQQVLAIIKK